MEWPLMQRKKVYCKTTFATLSTRLNVDSVANVA
jgi:hypothetical protein